MNKPIFVSYSRKDKDIVLSFVKDLQNEISDNRIWIDWSGIESGDEFEDRIIKAIDNSSIILFMLSNNSLSSEYAKKEVHYAYNNNKKVIPVVLDGKPLRGWFQFKFGNINYTDISDPDQVTQLKHNLKAWTNETIKKKYIDLAKQYLSENPKIEKYPVTYGRDDDMKYFRYINFTKNEIDCINHLIQDLDVSLLDITTNDDSWRIDPKEIEGFDTQYSAVCESVIRKLETDDEFWPEEVDLETAEKLYTFRRAIFPDGFDQKPDIYYFKAILSDEDYQKLLALKMQDRHMTFHELRKEMPELFESVSRQAENSYDLFHSLNAPYAIEMTEAEEDVFKIIGEPSTGDEIYNSGWTPAENGEDKCRHTYVNIEEKVLNFFMEDVTWRLEGDREYIENVDAIQVEKTLGVTSYKEIIERMKKDFDGPDGVQSFKAWLTENSIGFKYSETH